jgi:cation diffusion facilitator CzcD-associated flavoprotein CzcO
MGQSMIPTGDPRQELDCDAIIIGAGIAGLYSLYRLRELGLRVLVLEEASGVGGTWFWNRYPGARTDSESYTYGYTFSKELFDEWDWPEAFSTQVDIERYLNHVADKFDLRRHIRHGCRVAAAHFQEQGNSWNVQLVDGRQFSCRWLVMALGVLTAPVLPRIPGIDSFQGQSYHTARWPRQPVDVAGKRVAVIGTGASGIQTIQTIAKDVAQLTVFQRTANWAVPQHNRKLSRADMEEIRANHAQILQKLLDSPGCFLHKPDSRATYEVSQEEREALFEKLFAEPGLGIWQANFRDVLMDRGANALISDFIAGKIRQRVQDRAVARKLVPDNHGFGLRRVPLESGYYEVYNQPNVELVDVRETPIECFTPKGIRTSKTEYEFDIVIHATGFDAITGGYDNIDIRGSDGRRLKERWQDGPQTYLGVLVDGFPNMLMVMGPHAALGNYPPAMQFNVDWLTELLRHARARGATRIEAGSEAVAWWNAHVMQVGEGQLANEVDGWLTGVNTNIEGKSVRRVVRYTGGHPQYRQHCADVAADNYRGIGISIDADAPASSGSDSKNQSAALG